MDEQRIKKLLPSGIPASKQRLELKKLKEIVQELDSDNTEKFDFATEKNFREFILDQDTPGEFVQRFLKKCFMDAKIDFIEDGFKRFHSKKECLDLFFEVFTLGIDGGSSGYSAQSSVAEDESNNNGRDVSKSAYDVKCEHISKEDVDKLYKSWQHDNVTSISHTIFVVTKSIPIRAQDNFALRLRDNAPQIAHSKVALYNTHFGKTVAVGHLEGTDRNPALVFAAEDIDYDTIEKNRKHEIILFPINSDEKKFYTITCELKYQPLQPAQRTLCIDFGTSNTTAGSYGIINEEDNEPEFVDFPDVTTGKTSRLLPTLVYVDSCQKGQPIKYAFGYEAQKRIQDDHFESKATVFHEIKSWINDLDKIEEIYDSQGNNDDVCRRDIIKAYIHHVISLSQQYFKKEFRLLHFSAPVKLKDSFLQNMRQMFPKEDGYSILEDASSLDEGIAIVYSHIAKRIKDEKFAADKTETVFVIDCGGGTTDLAKCEYSYKTAEMDSGKKILSVNTSFENGDSAFGGNNITYRILQLLKIKIDACIMQKSNPDMLKIISDNEIDIMDKLDRGKNDIFATKEELYKDFQTAYNAAEEHIPTRYHDAVFDDDIKYMRRNYNYLWQMAEAIKIEFYKSSSTVSMDFNNENDKNICIGGAEDYYLYIRANCDSPLEKNTAPLNDIRITIKEISRIIYPDIYTLLSVLLGKYDNKDLLDVNYYRLSGQSFNINLFHDLMKEFVPGRTIRRKSGNLTDEAKTEELKLACIEGSIRYLMDKEFSQIQPKIEMAPPKVLYEVYEQDNEEHERLVLNDAGAELMKNFKSGRRTHLVVKDKYGQQKNSVFYNYELDKNKREDMSLGTLKNRILNNTYWSEESVERDIIEKLNDINLDENNNVCQCIFVLPAKNGYGFHIYQVRISYDKEVTKYSLIINNNSTDNNVGEYHSFEQMVSFFDGKR